MTRSMVLLSALVVGACTVGEAPPLGGVDAATGGDGTAANPRETCAARGVAGTAHIHAAAPADARSGVGCMSVGGCHGANPGSTVFGFAGTAYKQIAGTTVTGGAVVRIFKENPVGKFTLVKSAVTDNAGNFYMAGTFNDFPYVTDITACGSEAALPDLHGIRPMQGLITNANGNCNAGGACHAIPGTQAIYLAD